MISIIIPCYNSFPFIQDTINSCLSQTFKNFEIIIVDDGSNDGSGELIERIAQRYSEIVFTKQTNQGSCAARNKGLEIAQGKYILFLDADDLLLPEALELLLNGIGDFDASYSDVYYWYEDERLELKQKKFNSKNPYISIINEAPHCGAVLMRKKSIQAKWENKYNSIDEFYFFAKNAALGMCFTKIDACILKYRQHNSIYRKSNTATVKSSTLSALTNAYLELYTIHNDAHTTEKIKKSFYSLVFLTLFYNNLKSSDLETAKKMSRNISMFNVFFALFKPEMAHMSNFKRHFWYVLNLLVFKCGLWNLKTVNRIQ